MALVRGDHALGAFYRRLAARTDTPSPSSPCSSTACSKTTCPTSTHPRPSTTRASAHASSAASANARHHSALNSSKPVPVSLCREPVSQECRPNGSSTSPLATTTSLPNAAGFPPYASLARWLNQSTGTSRFSSSCQFSTTTMCGAVAAPPAAPPPDHQKPPVLRDVPASALIRTTETVTAQGNRTGHRHVIVIDDRPHGRPPTAHRRSFYDVRWVMGRPGGACSSAARPRVFGQGLALRDRIALLQNSQDLRLPTPGLPALTASATNVARAEARDCGG